MLLGLQHLAASLAHAVEFVQHLNALPAAAEDVLQNLPARVHEFVNQSHFSDYVFLGQGPYYGLACESALKVTEMSCSYAQSFHTLEFRHGPKSIVGAETLITFLISESSYDDEVSVLEEIKELGGTTLAIANRIDARARAAADFVVELGCSSSQYSCLASFVIPGQLLGLYTALHKGLDPDNPRNLSRVVVLKDEKRRENAAI
jgi:glucosamine--fructose-6-phosphate aminotransferase (isomerizing)